VTLNGDRVPDRDVSLSGGTYPWSPGERLVANYSGTSAIRDVKLIYAGEPASVVLASAFFPVSAGNSTPVNITTNGSIAVTSAPAGAGIRLDTFDTGRVTPFTLTNVTPGQHRIDVNLTGYYPANSTVSVTAGSTVNADFTLVKIPVYTRYPGFTVEAWVKWNVDPNPGGDTTRSWATVVVDGTADNNRRYQLQHNSDNTKFEFAVATATVSGSGSYLLSTTTPVSGTWYHVTGVYNKTPGTMAISVNGVQQTAKSVGVPNEGLRTSPGKYQIGGPAGISWPSPPPAIQNRKLNGDIRGVKTYEEALSQGEILSHYQAGVP
jgi:hypothetical protein